MPYIKGQDRERLLENNLDIQTTGELNYQITLQCREYLERHGLKYATINDIIGALESAKLEFYRRIAIPYEDIKIKENGDVYL